MGNAAFGRLVLQRVCACGCAGRIGGCQASDETKVQRAANGGGLRMLQKGSKEPAVRAVQQVLNELGATPQLDVDGDFGSRTDKAVRFFQRSHRLVADGIVGPATSTMLENERATEGVNFLEPCHRPEKPGPDAQEAEPLDDEPRRRGGNLLAEPGAAKVDLTLKFTFSAQDDDEAAAVGGKVVSVPTMADFKKVLDQHPNIGTLSVISHGGSDGTIVVGSTNVPLPDLLKELSKRPPGSITRIQFLGCNTGKDPEGMGQLKSHLGAGAVEGASCNLETEASTPVPRSSDGVLIETPADIAGRLTMRQFGALLKQNIPKFPSDRGGTIRAPDCMLGLRPNAKTLQEADPETVAKVYFARRGRLIFRFDPGGACWEDLKFDKADNKGCKRVQR